ncbi:MAG: hypothetical protein ACRELD_12040 [Longimicrobiales bacterium]
MTRRRRWSAATRSVAGCCGAAALAACLDTSAGPPREQTFTVSFEDPAAGLQGWSRDTADVDDPPITWSIERSTELASLDSSSVRLELANLNNAGKIWIERRFNVLPDTDYTVDIAFDFASADFGTVNLWQIIAGASADDPEDAADLEFSGDTGNGSDTDAGHVWDERRTSVEARSSADGRLYVFLGVWGTWEATRVYYIDDIRVTFMPH